MNWTNTLLFIENTKCVGSVHQNTETRMWHVNHLRWVRQNINPPDKAFKTERGAKRYVERYVRIWLVAGKPDAVLQSSR